MDNGASSYRRYLDGDESAFADIVKEYFDNLIFFIYRYVHDFGVAEDIALDAFTDLIVHKNRYHFGVSLKTYLFMIGRSRALDHIKRQKKLCPVPLTEAQLLADPAPGPEELLLKDAQKIALSNALEQISKDMRLVVHLVYFEQMHADEVGKILKKSRKQIYNLLYRAKNALRTILEKEGDLF